MANLKATTYQGLLTVLGNKDSAKIGNNTYVERGNYGVLYIRLHDTTIVKLIGDDVRKINSGGYQTTTTKERINQFLPDRYGLCQEKWEWYIVDRHNGWSKTPFYDGMVIR